MRSRFLLMPAALAMSTPAVAAYYMTLDEAQQLMVPRVKLTERFVTLSESQAEALVAQAQAPIYGYQVKAWQASNGDWFILDKVQGKDDFITYAVALNRDGIVQSVEILECVPDYNTVRMPAWLVQFKGQKAGEKRRIAIISGSTLSSQHITEGIRRVLATYDLVLKDQIEFTPS
jgi:FMN-binding domain